MLRFATRTRVRNTAVVLLLAVAAYATASQPREAFARDGSVPTERPDLAAVRQATVRYRDVANAVADGFISDGRCIGHPGLGAMGVHYIQPRRAGMVMKDGRVHGTDRALDPMEPEVLVYAPQKDGSLELAAVEWYASKEAWGEGEAPNIFGVPFDLMQDDPNTPDDEAHEFTPHYDQHVWLFLDNPKGLFAQWNPNVVCPAEGHGAHGHGAH